MGLLIWLIITTSVGVYIGYDTNMLIGAAIGFVLGLLIVGLVKNGGSIISGIADISELFID